MKKQMIALLVLTVVVTLMIAPLAMADHCRKCNATGTRCAIAASGGKPFCTDTSGTCVLSGLTCTGPHPFTEEPLAAEFEVVSVERLDEQPQPAANDTRVASLETTETAVRR